MEPSSKFWLFVTWNFFVLCSAAHYKHIFVDTNQGQVKQSKVFLLYAKWQFKERFSNFFRINFDTKILFLKQITLFGVEKK